MRRTLLRRAAAALLVVLTTAGLPACEGSATRGSVTVLGPWLDTGPGSEGRAFKQVLDAFTADSGIRVNYQESRALSQVLLSSAPGGTAPDVAILSTPGDLATYARTGKLHPLDGVLDDAQRTTFRGPWLLPRHDGGREHIYTVPIKANLTSLVWFNPARGPQPPPRTWEELVAYSDAAAARGTTPWCMGMGDAPMSGWPGIDLIEDIFVHRFGPDLYRRWARGDLPWTSDQVRQAWMSWGAFATDPRFVRGGPRTALLTDFEDAGRPLFTDPPGCLLEHQASFIMGFYQGKGYRDLRDGGPRPGVDFDFFPFPPATGKGRVWTVSVDLAGMFNDTPQARALLRFLATDEAQRIWPSIPGGAAFTVDEHIDPAVYGDDRISERIAEVFRSTDPLCFHVVDVLPAAMRTAYYRAVLEYLGNPGQLDQLLRRLDQIRAGIPHEEWLDLPCAR
ncbi:ABC transporter substrate-binding protein [Actinophytocola sp.]|uniref:ABC transporter substrate-binding protein n=1 Tax=Actinophytocola sp. TaxID=1872138 RepID=UPI0038998EEE